MPRSHKKRPMKNIPISLFELRDAGDDGGVAPSFGGRLPKGLFPSGDLKKNRFVGGGSVNRSRRAQLLRELREKSKTDYFTYESSSSAVECRRCIRKSKSGETTTGSTCKRRSRGGKSDDDYSNLRLDFDGWRGDQSGLNPWGPTKSSDTTSISSQRKHHPWSSSNKIEPVRSTTARKRSRRLRRQSPVNEGKECLGLPIHKANGEDTDEEVVRGAPTEFVRKEIDKEIDVVPTLGIPQGATKASHLAQLIRCYPQDRPIPDHWDPRFMPFDVMCDTEPSVSKAGMVFRELIPATEGVEEMVAAEENRKRLVHGARSLIGKDIRPRTSEPLLSAMGLTTELDVMKAVVLRERLVETLKSLVQRLQRNHADLQHCLRRVQMLKQHDQHVLKDIVQTANAARLLLHQGQQELRVLVAHLRSISLDAVQAVTEWRATFAKAPHNGYKHLLRTERIQKSPESPGHQTDPWKFECARPGSRSYSIVSSTKSYAAPHSDIRTDKSGQERGDQRSPEEGGSRGTGDSDYSGTRAWKGAVGDDSPVVFLWKGENYLLRMKNDMSFLDTAGPISSWLGFRAEGNPFFLPPDDLDVLGALAKGHEDCRRAAAKGRRHQRDHEYMSYGAQTVPHQSLVDAGKPDENLAGAAVGAPAASAADDDLSSGMEEEVLFISHALEAPIVPPLPHALRLRALAGMEALQRELQLEAWLEHRVQDWSSNARRARELLKSCEDTGGTRARVQELSLRSIMSGLAPSLVKRHEGTLPMASHLALRRVTTAPAGTLRGKGKNHTRDLASWQSPLNTRPGVLCLATTTNETILDGVGKRVMPPSNKSSESLPAKASVPMSMSHKSLDPSGSWSRPPSSASKSARACINARAARPTAVRYIHGKGVGGTKLVISDPARSSAQSNAAALMVQKAFHRNLAKAVVRRQREDYTKAASRVQRTWRGFIGRQEAKLVRRVAEAAKLRRRAESRVQNRSASLITIFFHNIVYRNRRDRLKYFHENRERITLEVKEQVAAILIQRNVRCYLGVKAFQARALELQNWAQSRIAGMMRSLEAAATRLQAVSRGYIGRQKAKKARAERFTTADPSNGQQATLEAAMEALTSALSSAEAHGLQHKADGSILLSVDRALCGGDRPNDEAGHSMQPVPPRTPDSLRGATSTQLKARLEDRRRTPARGKSRSRLAKYKHALL